MNALEGYFQGLIHVLRGIGKNSVISHGKSREQKTQKADGATGGSIHFCSFNGTFRHYLDIGFCGLVLNIVVFAVVSCFTKPIAKEHMIAFADDLKGNYNEEK